MLSAKILALGEREKDSESKAERAHHAFTSQDLGSVMIKKIFLPKRLGKIQSLMLKGIL
jgi:hypothetical protein